MKFYKIILSSALLMQIIIIPKIYSQKFDPGMVDGWYIRDSKITSQIIFYVKEYLSLNEPGKSREVNDGDEVIAFRSKRYSEETYPPLIGLQVGKWQCENVEIVLGRTFYEFIKQRDKYAWELWEERTKDPCQIKGEDIYWWMPSEKAQLSAFHSIFKIEKNWGIDANIGLDQLNYPWWYAGVFRAGFILQRFRFGIQAPIGMGLNSSSLRPRLLDAGLGGYIDFDVDNFFGELFFNDYVKKISNEELRDPNEIYFLTFGGNIGYSFFYNIPEVSSTLRISIGGEWHQVGQGALAPNGKDIIKEKRYPIGGPFLRFDLSQCDKNNIEVFAQYSNLSIMLGGTYNFTKSLGIEFRFVSVDLLRERKPWESSTMFMISPRLRF